MPTNIEENGDGTWPKYSPMCVVNFKLVADFSFWQLRIVSHNIVHMTWRKKMVTFAFDGG